MLIYSSYSKRHEWTELSSIRRSCSLKQPNAISSDRQSRQRIWRSTTKGRGHQTDESTKGQESSAEFSGNGQLFEALLSQVDETLQTTQTAASGRNGMDLGLFLSRCLRCHQRRALQDPSTRVLWLERRTRYSDWRFHVRIRCCIAARRKTSDLRIQISHSRWGTLFQHREGIARNGVRHGEASQLSVWWTNQSLNRSQTSRNDLEEEYCHCQPETSTTFSEACNIRNSSRVHLWEGELNCRRPESSRLSQSKAYGLKADGCDCSASHHFNCSSHRQPTWQNQNCHHCWSSLEPVKALHLSRLAASEAATLRTIATILELPWRTCSWRWPDIQSTSTCDSNFTESRVSNGSIWSIWSIWSSFPFRSVMRATKEKRKLCWEQERQSFGPESRMMWEMQLNYVTYAWNTSLLNRRNH